MPSVYNVCLVPSQYVAPRDLVDLFPFRVFVFHFPFPWIHNSQVNTSIKCPDRWSRLHRKNIDGCDWDIAYSGIQVALTVVCCIKQPRYFEDWKVVKARPTTSLNKYILDLLSHNREAGVHFGNRRICCRWSSRQLRHQWHNYSKGNFILRLHSSKWLETRSSFLKLTSLFHLSSSSTLKPGWAWCWILKRTLRTGFLSWNSHSQRNGIHKWRTTIGDKQRV